MANASNSAQRKATPLAIAKKRFHRRVSCVMATIMGKSAHLNPGSRKKTPQGSRGLCERREEFNK